MSNDLLSNGNPLFCDLYHLTMGSSWFEKDMHNIPKTAESFLRRNPFNGGYTLNAGLGDFVEWLQNWHFDDEQIEYLGALKSPSGEKLFSDDFLDFIHKEALKVDVYAIPEGEIFFPQEPTVSISGAAWQVELMEAAWLNIFNSQTVVATKSARVVQAAKERPIMEFALRRAHDNSGFALTRAAYIGGAAGTSNVAAGQVYNIPVMGTLAHSYMMMYDENDELKAFEDFLQTCKGNSVLLVDTYDTRRGIQNAIQASKNTGIPLAGVRIDSGDLTYWSNEARRMLDKAGMPKSKVVGSNDLDEDIIESLLQQGAKFDSFGVGTSLTNGNCGGVYKTVEVNGMPKMKIAEAKNTLPCAKNVVRLLREDGSYAVDVIVRRDDDFVNWDNADFSGVLSRDVLSHRTKTDIDVTKVFAEGTPAKLLLQPICVDGEIIYPERKLSEIRETALQNLAKLAPEYKRFQNPHVFGVGIEDKIYQAQQDLLKTHYQRIR